MSYLGLDLGDKTLGISISRSGIIAGKYKTLRHDNDLLYLKKEILDIIDREKIDIVVLGLPLNMDDSLGERAKKSLEFKKMLEENDIKVVLEDERLSTKEAEDILLEGDVSRKKRKKVIDNLAAVIILERYLRKEEK